MKRKPTFKPLSVTSKVYDSRVVKKTESIIYDEILESLKRDIDMHVRMGQAAVVAFQAGVAEDPTRALEWSMDEFKKFGRMRACQELASIIDYQFNKRYDEYLAKSSKTTVRHMRAVCFEKVIHCAKWPPRSTSVTSNLQEQEMAAGYADFLDTIDRRVQFYFGEKD